jgi:DNA-binding response OmpR family regulator
MRLLIVEDYEPTRDAVATGLKEEGYAVDTAATGTEGAWMAENNNYDLIILDIMLPELDGLEVLRRLRQKGIQTHVLLLTAKDTTADRVSGLNLGADDYLVKPFEFSELLARVHALLRRAYHHKQTMIHIADLTLDTVARRVSRFGERIDLTSREYALLELLALRTGHIVSRTEINESLYDFASDNASNVIDVFISYLRKKIDRDGHVKLLHTRRGFGYVLGVFS